MKKHPENEEICKAGLFALNCAIKSDQRFISTITKEGAPRLVLSLLDNTYTSQELGESAIEFLYNISHDKEALDILDSQNAFQSLMKF